MKIYIIAILVLFSLKASAQDITRARDNCDFLKNIHFINGVDTIVLKAHYLSVFSQGPELILKDLEKKKMINAKSLDHTIGFQVVNCPKEFMAAYSFKNKAAMDLMEKKPEGTTIYLTCIVFEGYYNYGEPFFIIDRLDMTAPPKM
jgi:hypothetical protein